MLKKNRFFIFTFLLLTTTSCCRYQETIEIPCMWQSPINEGMTETDPSCFLWWEALNDPILTSLIMDSAYRNPDVQTASSLSENTLLKTINDVSAEIARNYIEFRGLQMQSKILNENIEIQDEILAISKNLSNSGFFDLMKENEDQANLELLLVQRGLLNFSQDKIIFHLSALLNYLPDVLNEMLCGTNELPDLVGNIPIGCPSNLICQDPSVQEARKLYEASGTKPAFYNYQKKVLEVVENAETTLAAFNYQSDKIHNLEKIKKLKNEAYQLLKDLNSEGFKDSRDLLLAYQKILSEENLFVQGKVELLISYINLYHTHSCAWQACSGCSTAL